MKTYYTKNTQSELILRAKTITQKQSIYRDFYSDSLEYFDMLDA